MKKAALIGAGGVVFGKHREAYSALKDQIEIHIICDPSSDASAPMREWAGIPAERYVQSLNDLAVFKDEIDFAVVATPVKYHKSAVEAALTLGWDVLCEKPLAMSIAEVDAMLDCAEANNCRLGVMHNIRFSGEVHDTVAYIQAGNIGKVKLVKGHSFSKPWSGKEWRSDASQGGAGHFFDCLYHEIYCARAVIDSPITRVAATNAVLGNMPLSVEDVMLCHMEFDNGALASFEDVKAFPEVAPAMFATFGSEGAVVRMIPSPDNLHVLRGRERLPLPVDPASTEHGTLGVMQRFIDAIGAGQPLPYEIDAGGDGRENLRVVWAAYESAKTGHGIDMKNWNIRGSNKATAQIVL